MCWLISLLLAAPTMAQDGAGVGAQLPPPVNVSLTFNLTLTPPSPLLSFTNSSAITPLARGVPFNVSSTGSAVTSDLSYRLAPGAHMQAEVLGGGVFVEGTTSPDYDGWLWFRHGDGSEAQVLPNASPLLDSADVADALRKSGLSDIPQGGNDPASVSGAGTVEITNVTIKAGMNSSAESILQVPTAFGPFAGRNAGNIIPNPYYSYEGNWTVQTALPNGATYRTLVGEQNATIRIPVVPGTAFMVLNGTVGPEYGILATQLEPQPLFSLSPYVNASRPFTATSQPMYYASLDGGTNYTLTLRAEGRTGLHSMTFYAADKDASEPFSKKKAFEFPGFNYDEAATRLEPPGNPDESGARRIAASILFIAGTTVAAIAAW